MSGIPAPEPASPMGAPSPPPVVALPAVPATAMDRWLARMSDRLNPIVVKELRQGLRAKLFWVSFALMLLACLVISLIAFAATSASHFEATGQAFFLAYYVCLGLVQFFLIPYTAYRSLAREREDETWVLLSLTGLGPRRILLGKTSSFLIQAALYGSAAGPFLLFSYYLNGIDLLTILALLLLGAAYTVFLTAVSVSAATLAESRIFRALVHFGLLAFLLNAVGSGLTASFGFTFESPNLVSSSDFYWGVGVALWAMLSYGALLFEAAAARLSLATESYAKGPRLVFLAQLAVSVALAAYLAHREGEPEALVAAQMLFCGHIAVVGLFLATDADGLARPLRKGTRFFSLFRPGALRGFRLVMLALGVTTGVFFTLYLFADPSYRMKYLATIVAAGAYVALYLSVPLLLSRMLPIPALRTPTGARVLAVALVLLGSGMPPLMGELAMRRGADPLLNLFNPLVGLVNLVEGKSQSQAGLLVLCVVAALSAVAADRAIAACDDASEVVNR